MTLSKLSPGKYQTRVEVTKIDNDQLFRLITAMDSFILQAPSLISINKARDYLSGASNSAL